MNTIVLIILSLICWAVLLGGVVLTQTNESSKDVRGLSIAAGTFIVLFYLFALAQ